MSAPLPSGFIENSARIGLAARAVVYFLVGGLLLWAAIIPGRFDEGKSAGDAFRMLEYSPLGQMTLIAISIGLFLYAIWRFNQAVFDPDHKGTDAKGILSRLGMAASGTTYLLVGIAAFMTTFGENRPDGGGGATEQTVSWLSKQPFGIWLVGILGLMILTIGILQISRIVTDQWSRNLPSAGQKGWRAGIIETAIAGRGVLIVMTGATILYSAVSGRFSDAKGLATLLGWIRQQPFGIWLYAISAIVIGCYGVYSTIQVRNAFIST